MFCPKCGTENPNEGKFCRKCGTDISGVARAIGEDTHSGMDLAGIDLAEFTDLAGGDPSRYSVSRRGNRREDEHPDELIASGVKSAVLGFGFLVISVVLFFTGVAGGQGWWWAMLIPGFAMIASGLGNVAKAKRVERRLFSQSVTESRKKVAEAKRHSLKEAAHDFAAPSDSRKYETGEIIPPSVVEGTTRHLELDPESETMTLPETDKK